jgi:hypothetical protein
MLPWKLLHPLRFEKMDDVEIWICDECGKRVRTAPDFTVLERGDDTAGHIGSVGGIKIGMVEIKAAL